MAQTRQTFTTSHLLYIQSMFCSRASCISCHWLFHLFVKESCLFYSHFYLHFQIFKVLVCVKQQKVADLKHVFLTLKFNWIFFGNIRPFTINNATLEFLNTHRTHEPHVNFHVDYHKIQLKQKNQYLDYYCKKHLKLWKSDTALPHCEGLVSSLWIQFNRTSSFYLIISKLLSCLNHTFFETD